MTGIREVQRIDLTSQAFMRDPFPTFSRLRKQGSLIYLKFPFFGKAWLTTTHAATDDALKDHHRFVRDPKNAGRKTVAGMRWWMPRSLRLLAENMLGHDDPDHRRLRKLVDQAFNRQSVSDLRPRIENLCDELLNALPTNRDVDLISTFARPLPLAVICELLGLPAADRPRFSRWVQSMMSVNSLWGMFQFFPGLFRLMNYLRDQLHACRDHPRSGLLTALVQAEQDGDKLTENELLAMAFLLLVAGHETTVHLIAGSILSLLEREEQKVQLCSDWGQVELAVEELLRFVSPVQTTKPRYVSSDGEFHGVVLRRGELIVPSITAGNGDPARFRDPEICDLRRSPNPHLSFGTGVHFCLGAQLARVETQVVLQKLFSRFPRIRLACPSDELRYVGRIGLRALTRLPVRLSD